ncbi:MAG TPA: hypothetical protein VFK05_27445 [Polyangiaceae bacterium]|nr:hypothetical protein [Polyangiaceae bacterium]
MLEVRTLVIAGILSCSAIMCSGKERTFQGRGIPEAGQGGEAGEIHSAGASGEGDQAGEGGVGNLGGVGAEAGESSAGESSAGEAGAQGGEIAGAAGMSSSSGGSAGTSSSSGGSAGNASSGGSAGVNGAGGSAGGSGCPSATSRCVQAAPSGWQGPLLVTANPVNSCPSEFPTKSPVLYSGLVSGSASCACNCGAPKVSCGGNASLGFNHESGCSMEYYGQGITEDSCQSASESISMTYAGQVTATCNAAVVEKNFPVPTWTQAMNACSGAQEQGTCSANGELCLAKPSAPFAAKYCIARDGDQACPAAYSVRSVLFAGYQDTRACPSSCSCTASGQDCALQVDVHSQADCSGSYTRKSAPSSGSKICAISSPTSQHAYYATRVVTKPGTCSVDSTLSLTGAVRESGPMTLCCTE